MNNKEKTSQEVKKQINENVKKALEIIERNKKKQAEKNKGEER